MQKELQIQVTPETAQNPEQLKIYLASKFALEQNDILHIAVSKRSIDARQKSIKINLKVNVYLNETPVKKTIDLPHYKDVSNSQEVIVIGAGPAGLFAALKLIEMNRYDIVVLDIIGVDGFSILKKTVKMGIPSVMLTSNDLTKEAMKKAAKLGASAFLPKEKVADLEIFLSDIIKNNGKPIWEKLFERMSKYFEKELGWSPEDERRVIEKFGDVESSKKP